MTTRQKKFETATPDAVCWDFADDAQAMRTLKNAARNVARSFGVDQDQMISDAYAWAAARPDKINAYLADASYGYLYRACQQALGHYAKTMKRNQDLSLDELLQMEDSE